MNDKVNNIKRVNSLRDTIRNCFNHTPITYASTKAEVIADENQNQRKFEDALEQLYNFALRGCLE